MTLIARRWDEKSTAQNGLQRTIGDARRGQVPPKSDHVGGDQSFFTASLGLLGMARKLRITFTVCVAALFAYFSYLAWSFYYGVEAERSPFSSAAWKEKAKVYAHSNDPGCVRGGMALDIVATDLLQGKSIAEVKSLLGDPDGTKEGQVYHELGQCSGYGWHNSVLQVNFRNNQQVASAAILRHSP